MDLLKKHNTVLIIVLFGTLILSCKSKLKIKVNDRKTDDPPAEVIEDEETTEEDDIEDTDDSSEPIPSSLTITQIENVISYSGNGSQAQPYIIQMAANTIPTNLNFKATGSAAGKVLSCTNLPAFASLNANNLIVTLSPTMGDGLKSFEANCRIDDQIVYMQYVVNYPRLGFTGNSSPKSSPLDRVYVSDTTVAWTLTGSCDLFLGDVTVFGPGMEESVETPCVATDGGTFSLDINGYQNLPHFYADTEIVPFKLGGRKVLIKQSDLTPKATVLFGRG